jgi:hypothetical protein
MMTGFFAVAAILAGMGVFSPTMRRTTETHAIWMQVLDVVMALGFGTLSLVSHLS